MNNQRKIVILSFLLFFAIGSCTTTSKEVMDLGNDADAYFKKAHEFEKKKDLRTAILYYNKTIELSPGHGQAFLSRGIIELDLRKNDAAISDFNSAIESMPESALPYFLRAICFKRRQEYRKALADAQTAYRITPNRAIKLFINEMQKHLGGLK